MPFLKNRSQPGSKLGLLLHVNMRCAPIKRRKYIITHRNTKQMKQTHRNGQTQQHAQSTSTVES